MTPVFIATGAFDCGKTTTLEWLREHHGLRIHGEAHLRALASLGDRSAGHPPDRGFTRIDDPAHFCPLCRPRAFAELVLDEQRTIERAARPGDILERGYLDPIEMLLRNTGEGSLYRLRASGRSPDTLAALGPQVLADCLYRLQDSDLRPDTLAALGPQVLADCLYRLQDSDLRPDTLAALGPQGLADCDPRPAWTPIARYERVFLFEVMPELQRTRWGKSVERRIAEARAINERLERMYRDAGHEVIHIGPGPVEARAAALHDTLTR